jgi:hypothetical protein
MYPVNGLELVTAIRHQGSRVPIIMVSEHTEVKEQATAAGVDLFLGGDLLSIGTPIAEFLHSRGLYDRIEGTNESAPT